MCRSDLGEKRVLSALFERLFTGVESPGPTASSLRRVGLPLAQVPHRSLTAPKAFWLLIALMGSLGWLGYRRLSAA